MREAHNEGGGRDQRYRRKRAGLYPSVSQDTLRCLRSSTPSSLGRLRHNGPCIIFICNTWRHLFSKTRGIVVPVYEHAVSYDLHYLTQSAWSEIMNRGNTSNGLLCSTERITNHSQESDLFENTAINYIKGKNIYIYEHKNNFDYLTCIWDFQNFIGKFFKLF